ncbi:MAG: hypothetical protein PHR77_17255 [Kiritimatiellae bacterium]|nr:hypothetical protein [Kiritimatiellia bacterium]MDD5520432.1 hypothetical protein [Kiritimatiellia bacterium]
MKTGLKVLMLIACCFEMAILVKPACAGKLSDFKKDVSKGGKTTGSSTSSHSYHHETGYIYRERSWDSYHDHYFDGFGDIFYYGMAYGGVRSWERINRASLNDKYSEMYQRETGEVLIPFLRVDASYQMVASSVDAFDYSIDGGYGPIGVRFNRTHFREKDPDDTMDLTRVYGLYRMSLGRMLEVDLGLGGFSIDDEDDNRFSFTMPILIHPNKHLGFEFRPAWAGNISEYDIGVFGGCKFVLLKAGYKWLSGPSQTMDGPYAGLSVHF